MAIMPVNPTSAEVDTAIPPTGVDMGMNMKKCMKMKPRNTPPDLMGSNNRVNMKTWENSLKVIPSIMKIVQSDLLNMNLLLVVLVQ